MSLAIQSKHLQCDYTWLALEKPPLKFLGVISAMYTGTCLENKNLSICTTTIMSFTDG